MRLHDPRRLHGRYAVGLLVARKELATFGRAAAGQKSQAPKRAADIQAVASDVCAGSNRAIVRASRRRAAAVNAPALTGLGALGVAVTALFIVDPVPVQLRWFLVGVTWTAVVVAAGVVIHLATGEHRRVLGDVAEQFTARLICSHWQRLKGWRIVEGLYFAGHGDVDHVLVGPMGLWAVESKWVTDEATIDGDELHLAWGGNPLRQARTGARKVELALRFGRDRIDVRVRPMIVLWGPGAPSLPSGYVDLAGVTVVEGRTGWRYRRRFLAGDRLAPRLKSACLTLLTQLDAKQRIGCRPADQQAHRKCRDG